MLGHLKYLYRAYRYRYRLDRAEIEFIIRHLQTGDVAVDIGAHKGGYLYWLQKSVGETGRVYAFEPQLPLFEYLKSIQQTVSLNPIVLEKQGLSAASGTVAFHVPVTQSGTSPGARIDHRTDERVTAQTITVTTLDDYFFKRNIIPRLIKIDVEGHERQVMLGGENLLAKHQPVLLLECENRHLGEDDIYAIFEVLQRWGYRGYFFSGSRRMSIESFSVEEHQRMGEGRFWEAKDYVNNFAFIKE